MKNLGLSVLLSFSAILVVGNQAQANQTQKHPKYKVVTVSFSESDIRDAHRLPASVDEQQEVDAANRLAARQHTAEKSEIPD